MLPDSSLEFSYCFFSMLVPLVIASSEWCLRVILINHFLLIFVFFRGVILSGISVRNGTRFFMPWVIRWKEIMPPLLPVQSLYKTCLFVIFNHLHSIVRQNPDSVESLRTLLQSLFHRGIRQNIIDIATKRCRYVMVVLNEMQQMIIQAWIYSKVIFFVWCVLL